MHLDLTPRIGIKFLAACGRSRRVRSLTVAVRCNTPPALSRAREQADRTHYYRRLLGPALAAVGALAAAPSVIAQVGNLSSYQGPGILSRGVGDVGTRGGRPVDLRVYGGVSGIYDSSLQPFTTDANGNLVRVTDLYGIELGFGAYGRRNFRRGQLGLDYRGSYRRYSTSSSLDGSDHALTLGYTYQSSRRVLLDLRESVGTLALGNSPIAAAATGDPNSALNPTSLFLDTRTNYLQSTAAMTWLQSATTSYSFSGDGFLQDRSGLGVTNSSGYDLSGGVVRRVSKTVSIGGNYAHTHFEFPGFQSFSNSNAGHATFSALFARYWTFSLQAGVVVVEVENQVGIALDPFWAALLHQKTLAGIAYFKNTFPSGAAGLKRQFQRGDISFNYVREVAAGNGTFNTSRRESIAASASYNGIRKVSLNFGGGYDTLVALGQGIGKYADYSVSGGMTYNLAKTAYLTMRYDLRDQRIDVFDGYQHRGSRATVGVFFSPGRLPLSLW